jgi:hypothetical protein
MSVQADRGGEGTDPTLLQQSTSRSWVAAPLSGRFAREEDSVLTTQGAGRVSEPAWTGRKISPPTGFGRRTVQPVACRYTDYVFLKARSIIWQKLMCK